MNQKNPAYVARCRCGAVEVSAWGEPIIVTACYCNDCRTAAQRFAISADLPSAASMDEGTEAMVFPRDRIACTKGADQLQALKLTDASKTRRMIASCCATPMYLAFDDKRPWVSAFRAGFGAAAPPVEMRICTRSRRSEQIEQDDLPSHPGYPPAMMLRIMVTWPLSLLRRPVGALP